MLMCALFLPIAHETAGAARIRHSLRPLFGEGDELQANLGRNAPRERETVSAVIACDKREAFAQGSACDEAIHVTASGASGGMDCFASLAMTVSDLIRFSRIIIPPWPHRLPSRLTEYFLACQGRPYRPEKPLGTRNASGERFDHQGQGLHCRDLRASDPACTR